MTSFDRLHPAIQHHVVNTLGWRELRPLQEAAIEPLLQGSHALLLAPTAAGKTEAAILPLMSRMISEDWTGLSVVYLCPIKALLNNLHTRLSGYLQLVGRRAELWHGDVTSGQRKRLLRDPPDCLLTTPESLELMLTSSSTDERALFAELRAVVVDEIHAFAGDDRGWHIVCLLSRLSRLTRVPIQRIALSATVGNPEQLLEWFAGKAPGRRSVINPHQLPQDACDVTLDFVGSLDNAAFVISRMYRGQKRLVFCDSRSRAEQLAAQLRSLSVSTFVSHSSLSVDERRQAEEAFASASNCVIVATSTLELGIDVGDLDRVIQVDAPTTVGSYLQRLGRSGRRSGSTRNCLFLATSPNALLQGAALIRLWQEGYVEPTIPAQLPYHVVCQQLLALALQERGIDRKTWTRWLNQAADLAEVSITIADAIISSLIEQDILWDDDGVLWFGLRGERELGYRSFAELLSVFTSEPLLTARHGLTEIGMLHPLSLAPGRDGECVVLLGGRSWRVRSVDWYGRSVSLEPSESKGRSLWRGQGVVLGERLCGAMGRILTDPDAAARCSQRANSELSRLRAEYRFLEPGATTIHISPNSRATWWTFAGKLANDQVAQALEERTGLSCRGSNVTVEIDGLPRDNDVWESLATAKLCVPSAEAIDAASGFVKFASYLPEHLRVEMLRARLADQVALAKLATQPIRWSTGGE